MGYRVQYPEGDYKYSGNCRIARTIRPIMTFLLISLLFGAAVFPKSRAMLLELLIPGDEKVTTAAMEGLICDMRRGDRFEEAFVTFCETVLYGEEK